MLEPAEIGRHDEILRSVVAHNARRRAQRYRAARYRHFARLGSRLAFPFAFGVGVYFAVVLMSGLLGLGEGSGEHAAAAVTPAAAPAQQPVVLGEAGASPARPVATFTISAARGAAFVEVRRRSRTGPLLTRGIVPRGETIAFSNRLLWVDVRTPQNLDLSVNGKLWRPSGGSVVATLTPTGARR